MVQAAGRTTTLRTGHCCRRRRKAVPVVVGGYDDLPPAPPRWASPWWSRRTKAKSVTVQRSASAQVAEGALAAEILPGELYPWRRRPARFKLTNPSLLPIEFKVAGQQGAQASAEARLKVLDLQGALLLSTPLQIALGDDVVALPDGDSHRSRACRCRLHLAIRLASSAGLGICPGQRRPRNRLGLLPFRAGRHTGDAQGPQARQQVSTIETPYRAEVTADSPAESNGDQPIAIQGRALWRSVDTHRPLPGRRGKGIVTVDLDGFIRQDSVLTGTDGSFTYTFQPGAAERRTSIRFGPRIPIHPAARFSGHIHNPAGDRFPAIVRCSYAAQLPPGAPVGVLAGAGTTVQNLRAVLAVPLPAAVSVDTPAVSVLAPGENITLPLAIVGLAPTGGSADTGTLIFHVVSDDGVGGQTTWADITVNYTFSAAKPYLQATPSLTELGVQPGQTASGTVVLNNLGLAPLEDATLSFVSADDTALPAWIRLQTPAALGTMDIGAGQSVIVSAAPPVDGQLIDVVYHFYLHVQGGSPAAAAGQDFPVSVTVSPGGKGGALLKIVDPYYQLTLPDGATNAAFNGLAGASVVLEKESSTGVPTITQGATTDTNGEVEFTDLPAGSYKLRINADRHEPYVSRIVIKPGVIYADQIALAYNPVTFTWEVVPVTFQDRYDIVLTATYETNVPVPVVVIEPSSINLPKMCAGQVFTGEFRIANHGLIDAHDVNLPVPATDENFSYELLSNFGDTVKAGQTVTVSYRVKCLKPLPGACSTTADDSPHFWSRFIASLGGGNGGPGGPSVSNSGAGSQAAMAGLFSHWPLNLGCSALGGALLAAILLFVNLRPCVGAKTRCARAGKPADRIPSIPARLVFAIRLVLVAEFGVALPPGVTADGDGGCGTYANCTAVSYSFVGACGIKYTGSTSACIYSVYGSCSGGGTGIGHPTPVGVGIGGPGSPSGWQGSGGGGASDNGCNPKPQQRCDLPGLCLFTIDWPTFVP